MKSSKSKFNILLSKGFLIALFLLFINDFYLKYKFPSFLTGKLSDFAGLFAFYLFLICFFPKYKKKLIAILSLAFIFWKSPYSQLFIDKWNLLPLFTIQRTVDYTDLIALVIIPFGYYYSLKVKEIRFKMIQGKIIYYPLIIVSLFLFFATSKMYIRDFDYTSQNITYELDISRLALVYNKAFKTNKIIHERIKDKRNDNIYEVYLQSCYLDLAENIDLIFTVSITDTTNGCRIKLLSSEYQSKGEKEELINSIPPQLTLNRFESCYINRIKSIISGEPVLITSQTNHTTWSNMYLNDKAKYQTNKFFRTNYFNVRDEYFKSRYLVGKGELGYDIIWLIMQFDYFPFYSNYDFSISFLGLYLENFNIKLVDYNFVKQEISSSKINIKYTAHNFECVNIELGYNNFFVGGSIRAFFLKPEFNFKNNYLKGFPNDDIIGLDSIDSYGMTLYCSLSYYHKKFYAEIGKGFKAYDIMEIPLMTLLNYRMNDRINLKFMYTEYNNTPYPKNFEDFKDSKEIYNSLIKDYFAFSYRWKEIKIGVTYKIHTIGKSLIDIYLNAEVVYNYFNFNFFEIEKNNGLYRATDKLIDTREADSTRFSIGLSLVL